MNTLKLYAALLGLLLGFAACNNEKKCDVACQNGGNCLDGICNCAHPWTGATCTDIKRDYTEARFFAENSGCMAPCTVSFKNRSVGAVSYLWDFGDGTTSTEKEPLKVYTSGSSSGSGREYQVQLTTTAADGVTKDVASDIVYIKANSVPPCEQNNTAEITVIITSSNPYMVNIAGVDVGIVQGNSSRTFTTSATGSKVVKVTQQSGFVFTPTVETTDINFTPCSSWRWTPTL